MAEQEQWFLLRLNSILEPDFLKGPATKEACLQALFAGVRSLGVDEEYIDETDTDSVVCEGYELPDGGGFYVIKAMPLILKKQPRAEHPSSDAAESVLVEGEEFRYRGRLVKATPDGYVVVDKHYSTIDDALYAIDDSCKEKK